MLIYVYEKVLLIKDVDILDFEIDWFLEEILYLNGLD